MLAIREIRGKEEGLKWSGTSQGIRERKRKVRENQGILTVCPDVKVLSTWWIIFVKMLHQEVMEDSLRSGRSQGKARENESRKIGGHPVKNSTVEMFLNVSTSVMEANDMTPVHWVSISAQFRFYHFFQNCYNFLRLHN